MITVYKGFVRDDLNPYMGAWDDVHFDLSKGKWNWDSRSLNSTGPGMIVYLAGQYSEIPCHFDEMDSLRAHCGLLIPEGSFFEGKIVIPNFEARPAYLEKLDFFIQRLTDEEYESDIVIRMRNSAPAIVTANL